MELQMLGARSFFWPVAALVTLAWFVRRRRDRGPVADVHSFDWVLPAVAAGYLLLVTAAYVVTTYQPFTAQVETSAFRLALHVLPLVVIWTVGAAQDLAAPDRLAPSRRPVA